MGDSEDSTDTMDPWQAENDAQGVAGQFLQHYYGIFDGADRSQLGALYAGDSKMQFEGARFKGQAEILGKLGNLGFQACRHDLQTARLDTLVTAAGGIYLLVTGVLSVDGGNPMPFAETF